MPKTILILLLLLSSAAYADSVPLIFDQGTYLVPVVINDAITLNFTVDSGSADVSIPVDVFSTLTRTGTILPGDMMSAQTYVLADGSTQKSKRFRIRSLRVGGVELHDVVASVAPVAGNLLLGQSFLSRMKSWSIDNENHRLVFNESPALTPRALARVIAPPEKPQQSASMTDADNATLLKAVAFALTGDDSTHVSDWPDCVFQIKVGSPVEVLTFHMNNIDPARIRITDGGDIHIAGEGVVLDEYGKDSLSAATALAVLTHHDQWTITTHTTEPDRLLRAWKYIYSHGCQGQKSSF